MFHNTEHCERFLNRLNTSTLAAGKPCSYLYSEQDWWAWDVLEFNFRFSESKKIQKEQNYLVNSFPPSHKIEKNRLTLKTPLPSWRVKTAFFGWVHEYYPMHVAKWLSAGREITFWSGSLQILCEICFLCWIEIFGRRRWTSSELMVKSGTDYISCLPNKPKSRSVGQRSEQRWPVIIDLCSKIEKVKHSK